MKKPFRIVNSFFVLLISFFLQKSMANDYYWLINDKDTYLLAVALIEFKTHKKIQLDNIYRLPQEIEWNLDSLKNIDWKSYRVNLSEKINLESGIKVEGNIRFGLPVDLYISYLRLISSQISVNMISDSDVIYSDHLISQNMHQYITGHNSVTPGWANFTYSLVDQLPYYYDIGRVFTTTIYSKPCEQFFAPDWGVYIFENKQAGERFLLIPHPGMVIQNLIPNGSPNESIFLKPVLWR